MNKTIIAIVAGVAVIGGGAYFFMNSSGSDSMNEEENASIGSTFAELVAQGQSVECTFSYDDNAGNKSSGTVYMTEGAERIRGDFDIEQSAGGPMDVHLIRDGGYNYLWGSFNEGGIKTAVTAENEDQLFDENGNATVDENTEYSCVSWRVDESKFALPSDVVFTDFSAQMEASMNAGGDMKAMQCGACNQLSGESKTQCLQALGC